MYPCRDPPGDTEVARRVVRAEQRQMTLPSLHRFGQTAGRDDRVKATPRQQGVEEIPIPGERAFRSRERALREGIEIDRVVYEAIAALYARSAAACGPRVA
jgi:LDH2 family malate/lactate/ureidoglycolate dehydrogenase